MNIGLPLLLRRWFRQLLAAGLLATAAGCTKDHAVNTYEPANPAYVRHTIQDKRVIRDRWTARSVNVLNVIEGSSDTGLARVGVEVQNQRTFAFRFNYRFDWFDSQGLPVASPTATMISQQLEAGQVMTLMSVAPTPNAKDFRLSIQESTRDYFPILPKN